MAAQEEDEDAGEEGVGAITRYREALALAEELEMRPLQPRCHLGLGVASHGAGKTEDARRQLARAAGEFRRDGDGA